MKREFLQNFKVGEVPLPKDVIDAIMAENGRDIEDAKKPYADYDTMKNQLEEAQKTIKGFEDQDIDGVRKSAKDWEDKYNKAVADHAEKMDTLALEGVVRDAIMAAGGRTEKAIRALMDMDALKASKDRKADAEAAVAAIKKATETSYLFGDAQNNAPPPYSFGTGQNLPGSKYTPEIAAIRSAAGLKNE